MAHPILITYEGYALYEWGRGYKSLIDDKWMMFDTAGQWVQYIRKFKLLEQYDQ